MPQRRRWVTLAALLAVASASLAACATGSATIAQGGNSGPADGTMLVRLSELEIEPQFLDAYVSILREEAADSVRLEPGVIAIFPMQQKEEPAQIRIIEIYADRAAYEAHLQTPHFKHYKTATLHMVKSLRLVDMSALDPASMPAIFRKLGR